MDRWEPRAGSLQNFRRRVFLSDSPALQYDPSTPFLFSNSSRPNKLSRSLFLLLLAAYMHGTRLLFLSLSRSGVRAAEAIIKVCATRRRRGRCGTQRNMRGALHYFLRSSRAIDRMEWRETGVKTAPQTQEANSLCLLSMLCEVYLFSYF